MRIYRIPVSQIPEFKGLFVSFSKCLDQTFGYRFKGLVLLNGVARSAGYKDYSALLQGAKQYAFADQLTDSEILEIALNFADINNIPTNCAADSLAVAMNPLEGVCNHDACNQVNGLREVDDSGELVVLCFEHRNERNDKPIGECRKCVQNGELHNLSVLRDDLCSNHFYELDDIDQDYIREMEEIDQENARNYADSYANDFG